MMVIIVYSLQNILLLNKINWFFLFYFLFLKSHQQYASCLEPKFNEYALQVNTYYPSPIPQPFHSYFHPTTGTP